MTDLRFDPDQMFKNCRESIGNRRCNILCGDTVVGVWVESNNPRVGLTEEVFAVYHDPEIQAKLDAWFAAHNRRKAAAAAQRKAQLKAELKERHEKELADARKAMGLE